MVVVDIVVLILVGVLKLSALVDNVLVIVDVLTIKIVAGCNVDSVTIDSEAVVGSVAPGAGNLLIFDNSVLADGLSVDWAWLSGHGTSSQEESSASWGGTADVGSNNLDAVLSSSDKVLSVENVISQVVNVVVSVEVLNNTVNVSVRGIDSVVDTRGTIVETIVPPNAKAVKGSLGDVFSQVDRD